MLRAYIMINNNRCIGIVREEIMLRINPILNEIILKSMAAEVWIL